MKKQILTFILIIFSIASYCQDDNYGITWTKIYVAKNIRQAKRIKSNFNKANIGQEISFNQVDSIYYIELNYEDDDEEKYNNIRYCIPRRLLKNLIELKFILVEDNIPLTDGKGNYIIY